MSLTDYLRGIEEQLLKPEVRKDAAVLSALIADDFLEFGASGSTYDKAASLEALAAEAAMPPALLSDFNARQLTHDVVLVTYRTTRRSQYSGPVVSTQRYSIWVYRNSRWQITFHQGTPLP